MSTAFRRVAVVAAPAMILSGLAIAAGPDAVAAPPYDQSPIAAASAWDSSQMTGNLLTTNFGGTEFKDYGLSADYAISLADVGGRAVTVSAISAAVANEVDSYVSDGLGSPTESYAGPLAKSIVLAKAAAADPTSYGGKNLVSLLEARVGTGAPSHPTGRIADLSAFGDFANVFGQAYAAQALKSVGSPQTGAVTDFLLQQQCSTGFFRLNFADAAAADQSCDGASPAATPDTDVTAYAVIALRSQAGDPDVDTALSKAVAYLKATQKADGSFGGSGPTAAPNANSTGLAGWAFGKSGDVANAEKAATWLRQHQLANLPGCASYATADLGAVAYDDAGLAAVHSAALTPTTRGQFVRATAQAIPALQWAQAGPGTVSVAAPHKGDFEKAGAKETISVTTANPGDVVCVRLRGSSTGTTLAADAGGRAATSVTLPAGDGTRTYDVVDSSGFVATVKYAVLDGKKFKVKVAKAVHSGHRVVVRISGLAHNEIYKVFLDGKRIDKRAGSRKGEATVRFHAGSGRHKVTVVGAFEDRTGKVRFRVAR